MSKPSRPEVTEVVTNSIPSVADFSSEKFFGQAIEIPAGFGGPAELRLASAEREGTPVYTLFIFPLHGCHVCFVMSAFP